MTGTGEGAAIENIAPVRSMRVDGPGAWRSSKFSTKSADTMCMAVTVPADILVGPPIRTCRGLEVVAIGEIGYDRR